MEIGRGEQERTFEEVETEWREALGYESNSETDDDYSTDDDEDSTAMTDEESDEDEDIEVTPEEFDELSEDTRIQSILDDYIGSGAGLYSVTELEDLKEKEKVLIERNESGYYRCKHRHTNMYQKISKAYQPYITEKYLRQLHHPWTTQTNEALNKSVSSYAPKDRTFSTTKSLKTRVDIAASVQVSGQSVLWNRTLPRFNVKVNPTLDRHFRQMDVRKENKRRIARTNEGKIRRNKKRYEKFNNAFKLDQQAQKEGTHYQSGVATKKATKIARNLTTNSNRNPPGTHQSMLKCRFYHPAYCTVLGHDRCNSKDCLMRDKTKGERDVAAKAILDELVNREFERIRQKRK